MNRRAALSSLAAVAATPGLAAGAKREDSTFEVAAQEYPWRTWAKRAGEPWPPATAEGLRDVLNKTKAAGCAGWEPLAETAADIEALWPELTHTGLDLGSVYTNAVLHDPAEVEAETNRVLGIVDAARVKGCRVLVLNPTPIRRGGDENKSDGQLRTQRAALERLGRAVAARGVGLAYHNHDAELRAGAREYHHMLAGTDPAAVKLCLDAHWVFRGCGNSAAAALDAARLYGDRVAEIHLRNSEGGTWTEAFGPGDLDHAAVRGVLESRGVGGFGLPGGVRLVLEQAIEEGTAVTMTPAAAHAAGARHAKTVFG